MPDCGGKSEKTTFFARILERKFQEGGRKYGKSYCHAMKAA